jgi:protein SCO1/2
MEKLVSKLQELVAGWRFPALILAVLLGYAALMLAVLLIPPPPSLAQFADDFKVWCFGLDSASGKMERVYVFQAFAEPIGLSAIIALLWRKPLRHARPRALAPYVLAGIALVGIGGWLLVRRETRAAAVLPLEFPAKSLRVAHVPPPIDLADQSGAPIALAAFKGKVVMLTGVYTSCGYTCPRLLAGTRKAIYALPPEERSEIVVLAITLDPEHDGPRELRAMAHAQKVDDNPNYHFLSGPPADVNRTLDALEIARTRDDKTGVIDHASVFVLVDRSGKIAYRIALGSELEETWLVDALKSLLRDPA